MRKVSISQLEEIIAKDRALVKVLTEPDRDLNFIYPQLLDPENNRPVKKLHRPVDRTLIFNPETMHYEKRDVNAVQGRPKPNTRYTKKTSCTLLPRNTQIKLYSSEGVVLIFDYAFCHVKPKYIFNKNVYSNEKWWLGEHQGYTHIAVPLKKLINDINAPTKEIQKHNEILAGLSLEAHCGIASCSTHLEDKIVALITHNTAKNQLNLDLPLMIVTPEGFKRYPLAMQSEDIAAFLLSENYSIKTKIKRLKKIGDALSISIRLQFASITPAQFFKIYLFFKKNLPEYVEPFMKILEQRDSTYQEEVREGIAEYDYEDYSLKWLKHSSKCDVDDFEKVLSNHSVEEICTILKDHPNQSTLYGNLFFALSKNNENENALKIFYLLSKNHQEYILLILFKSNNIEILNLIFKMRKKVVYSIEGLSPLFHAISYGYFDLAASLIENSEKFTVSIPPSDELKKFFEYIQENHPEKLLKFLKFFPKFTLNYKHFQSLIGYSIKHKYIKKLSKIISPYSTFYILKYFLKINRLSAVEIFLRSHSMQIDNLSCLYFNNQRLMCFAIEANQISLVLHLLRRGDKLSFSASSKDPRTPIKLAINLKRDDLLSQILNLNLVNVDEKPISDIIKYFFSSSDSSLRKIAINYLAKYSAKNSNIHAYAFHKLMENNLYEEATEFLKVHQNLSVNYYSANCNALHHAITHQYIDLIRILLNKDGNIFAQYGFDKTSKTPLDHAILHKKFTALFLFLTDGHIKKTFFQTSYYSKKYKEVITCLSSDSNNIFFLKNPVGKNAAEKKSFALSFIKNTVKECRTLNDAKKCYEILKNITQDANYDYFLRQNESHFHFFQPKNFQNRKVNSEFYSIVLDLKLKMQDYQKGKVSDSMPAIRFW